MHRARIMQLAAAAIPLTEWPSRATLPFALAAGGAHDGYRTAKIAGSARRGSGVAARGARATA
jgi:hypothetical protein